MGGPPARAAARACRRPVPRRLGTGSNASRPALWPAYADDRDRPAIAGTSGLSPYLRFGCIHPRTVLERLRRGAGPTGCGASWPGGSSTPTSSGIGPIRPADRLRAFGDHLRWDTGERARDRFRAWATGQTGYPLVDAGMRQLLAEGWMHNRVRMVTASFLVKDLHIDWRLGARWFMWHLVDGDLASNQHGWQWVAGTGTDAAPFHRVFNPRIQQERFDPDGGYVRRYLGDSTTSLAHGIQDGLSSSEGTTPNLSLTTRTSGAKHWHGTTRRADLRP